MVQRQRLPSISLPVTSRRLVLAVLLSLVAALSGCKKGHSPEYKEAIEKIKEAQEWSTSGYMVGDDWDEAVRLLKLVPQDNARDQKRVQAYLKTIIESRKEWTAKEGKAASMQKNARAAGAELSNVHEKKKAYVRIDPRGKPGKVEWVTKKSGRKVTRSCVRHWSKGVIEVVANSECIAG